jgi:chemotaxis protein MotC
MRAKARNALVLAALFLAGRAGAQVELVKISDMADDLQRIQIRMAQGDKSAYPAQLKQLKAMGAAIASAKPEIWQDRREADALVIYVLSGGALGDVMALLKSDAVLESDRTLARGALAYITSHEADALDLLSAVDIRTLEPRLAGQIAFARSVLETKRDPKAAASLLDWARLVAPGGLVEEAALRREIALVAEARDAPRAAMLTRQYASRFGASLYAADFFRELARLIARFGLADDPANYQLLSGAAASLPPDGRRDFLLTLAKAAIVNARLDAAASAAAEALKSASADSVDEARARLYLDAGRLLSGGYDAARADLQAIATSRLDRSDAGLLASVRGVAAQLRTAPSAGAVEAQGAQPGEGDKASGPAQTIGLAEVALKRTESEAGATVGRSP